MLRACLGGLLVLASAAVTASTAWAQAAPIAVTLDAIASAGPQAGEVYDTATISGGTDVTGTVTFTLFGPNDETCSGAPVFTSVKPVVGVGSAPVTVDSDHAFLTAPGVYHFVASYSGDALHAPAGPTVCGDPSQSVGFGSSSISFGAQASPTTTVGGEIWDTATVGASSTPTGALTFTLFGPDDASCTATPVFTSVVPVNGDGSYRSAGYHPTRPGTYDWVAHYSGDDDTPPMSTTCGDPNQRVPVSAVVAQPRTSPSGLCAVLAAQRSAIEGQMQALRQALGPLLDEGATTRVNDAVSSAWSAQMQRIGAESLCG